ncbi:ATP-binding protein [Thiothrix lacustris]|uniref:ATP-binding protein n=1 Tax=Thiothrix lacustris TaxID=525917 RepID=UPI0027E5657A|nr:ATP-binding protein [Thiothrix lacustris]WMP19448.1 response regulator [Thiothrix lacustris]
MSVVQAERVRILREAMYRAEAANQAKSNFLATMSHELRTPINAITGLSTLLRLTRLDAQQQEYVSKLELSSRHMSQLVGDMLDMAKIESDHFQLSIAPFRLNITLRQIHDLLMDKARNKGLQLVFEGTETVTETLLGDRVRLSQIVINLLDNAIKYSAAGTVTLTVHKQPCADKGKLFVYFSINYAGVGIPPGKLVGIFDTFAQLDNPHTFHNGVGLGLAISREFVAHMGGDLAAESTLGEGSHFFFTLPFKVVAKEVGYTPPVSNGVLSCRVLCGISILLVDDDDDIGRLVGQKLLQSLGALVTVAADGQSSIQQLQQSSFDIVLLDICMDDLSGFEVMNWICQYAPNSKIPIIVLTAHVTLAVERQCQDAGANAFLGKPFELLDLYRVIHRVLAL